MRDIIDTTEKIGSQHFVAIKKFEGICKFYSYTSVIIMHYGSSLLYVLPSL